MSDLENQLKGCRTATQVLGKAAELLSRYGKSAAEDPAVMLLIRSAFRGLDSDTHICAHVLAVLQQYGFTMSETVSA